MDRQTKMNNKPENKEQGLKPCPFCNYVPNTCEERTDMIPIDTVPTMWYGVLCEHVTCLINPSIYRPTLEEAIQYWNTRSNDQLKKELERLNIELKATQKNEHELADYNKDFMIINQQLQAELDKYKWIPVSERLPEEVGEYLVWGYDGAVADRYLNTGEWLHDNYVTHWMPLPDPPKHPDSHLVCPGCGVDAGHDREHPPNPYYCDACAKDLPKEEGE